LLPTNLQIGENYGLRGRVIPVVAGGFLVMPHVLACIGSESDDRRQVKIIPACGTAHTPSPSRPSSQSMSGQYGRLQFEGRMRDLAMFNVAMIASFVVVMSSLSRWRTLLRMATPPTVLPCARGKLAVLFASS
jgi:hypothetical protein